MTCSRELSNGSGASISGGGDTAATDSSGTPGEDPGAIGSAIQWVTVTSATTAAIPVSRATFFDISSPPDERAAGVAAAGFVTERRDASFKTLARTAARLERVPAATIADDASPAGSARRSKRSPRVICIRTTPGSRPTRAAIVRLRSPRMRGSSTSR